MTAPPLPTTSYDTSRRAFRAAALRTCGSAPVAGTAARSNITSNGKTGMLRYGNRDCPSGKRRQPTNRAHSTLRMTGRLAIVFLSSLQVLGIAGRFEGVNFSTNASKKRGRVIHHCAIGAWRKQPSSTARSKDPSLHDLATCFAGYGCRRCHPA
jgi:hypothetical protein